MNARAASLAPIGALVFILLASLGEATRATAIMGVVACAIFGAVTVRARVAPVRLAVVALVLQALFTIWASVSAKLDSTDAAAIALTTEIAAGGIVTAALAAVAGGNRSPLAIAGAAAWALGWGLRAATLLWLAAWILDLGQLGTLPDLGVAPDLLRLVGGLAFGWALAARMRDANRRTSATAALAAFGATTVLVIVLARSLLGATDLQAIGTKRLLLGLAEGVSSLALAGFIALYRRDAEVEQLPRATMP